MKKDKSNGENAKIARGFSDAEAKKDLMGIENYTKGLAEFIQNCCTPMTIAIQGSWGTGKTSIMNFVYKHFESSVINTTSKTSDLKKNDQIIYIPFNTWQFSQFNADQQLPFSLITYLIEQIEKVSTPEAEKGKNKNLSEKVKKILRTLYRAGRDVGMTLVEYYSKGLSSAASGPVIAISDALEKEVEEHDEKYNDLAGAIVDLKNTFQSCINKAITGDETKEPTGREAKRIVVFIDDLDRLEPPKAVELLEVLKLFMNCPGCVFVLAIDYDVVIKGVNAKYGEFDDNPDKGKQFFDKIIQLPFKVPTANYQIDNYVLDLLSKIGIDGEEDHDFYVDLINYSVGTNPRTIKRLFNAFQLLTMIEKQINSEINNELLFTVICLQYAYESLYNHMVEASKNSYKSVINIIDNITTHSVDELNEKYDLDFSIYNVDTLKGFMKTISPLVSTNEDAQKFADYLKVSTTTSQVQAENTSNNVVEVKSLDELDFTNKDDYENAKQIETFIKEKAKNMADPTVQIRKSSYNQWLSLKSKGKVIINVFFISSTSDLNTPFVRIYGKKIMDQLANILKSENIKFTLEANDIAVDLSAHPFNEEDQNLINRLISVKLGK